MTKRLVLGAVIYGLAVHFRIYPIIFCLAFLLLLDQDYSGARHDDS